MKTNIRNSLYTAYSRLRLVAGGADGKSLGLDGAGLLFHEERPAQVEPARTAGQFQNDPLPEPSPARKHTLGCSTVKAGDPILGAFPAPELRQPMILADNETKVDLLNNEAIASTIVQLLRDRPDKPVTVGVHGDWGAGKSSILEMVEASFGDEKKVLCLKFNGWRFQGFEDAKIALIEGIVTAHQQLLRRRAKALNKSTCNASMRVEVVYPRSLVTSKREVGHFKAENRLPLGGDLCSHSLRFSSEALHICPEFSKFAL